MTNNQSWRHADIYFLTVELILYNLLSLLRDRHKSVDKEFGDTWNKLHNSTHGNTKEQNLLDIKLSQSSNQCTNDYTKYQWLAKHSELLLKSLSIDIELRETRNHIEALIDEHSEWSETLNERLWDRDSLHTLVVALELRSSKVCHNQRVDVAHDSGKIAPCQALIHNEISYRANEGEVPVVPQVDIYGTCGLGNEHQEVNTQTNGDNQSSNCCVISYCCCSRPTHIENAKLEVVEARNLAKRATEIVGKKGCNNTQTYESHTYVKS